MEFNINKLIDQLAHAEYTAGEMETRLEVLTKELDATKAELRTAKMDLGAAKLGQETAEKELEEEKDNSNYWLVKWSELKEKYEPTTLEDKKELEL